MPVPHWADVLTLRAEVTQGGGSVGDLQMSLHKVVYQTVQVPYHDVGYYADITQPTPNMVGFFARVARRLSKGHERFALYHLDQGMGGGKSHALVGLHHMASRPDEFFATDLGQRVHEAVQAAGDNIDLVGTRVVALTADYFSPGKPTESFGPATNLFERFIWSLTRGDRVQYDRYLGMGVNKETLQLAFREADAPVLILLDELMDYVQELADERTIGTMPTEQAFVSALMDACDDVDRVVFVLVMIRSDFDESGYHPRAQEFRDYVARRRERNGDPVAVTEPQDFAAIIRRRLFEIDGAVAPARDLALAYEQAAVDPWREAVVDKLGSNRGFIGLVDRIEACYPFHPDLMRLVREEWSKVQGFQRVRSTVAIFAKAAVYWANEHNASHWAPALIGVGDIPLPVAVESVLGSGLLLGNDRSIQGFRAVVSTDITSADASGGRAVVIDRSLHEDDVDLRQPSPAVRMATALFCYSLVTRAQGRRGAVKAELLASVLEPAQETQPIAFADAEEAFNRLVGEDGLGSLEVISPSNAAARYWLSTVHTLRARFRAAAHLVSSDEKDAQVWRTAQELAKKGHFEKIIPVDAAEERVPLEDVFHAVDTDEVRLVVLDPQRWMLHNGRDQATRKDLQALFGLGPQTLPVDNAASCVVACINAYKREHVRRRAGELLAWQGVLPQLPEDSDDEIREVRREIRDAKEKLEQALLAAFQHYVYLIRSDGQLEMEDRRFDDRRSSLRGEDVWADLVAAGRAVSPRGLSGEFLAALLDRFDRQLTLREIRQAFYKNPDFPLVPGLDEIRFAEFDLLALGWEMVDASGEPADITNPEQIAVNSVNLSLRRHPVKEPSDEDATCDGSEEAGTDGVGRSDPGEPKERPHGGTTPVTYRRYRMRIPNQSIVGRDDRDSVWKLVAALHRVLDPARDEYDHQLIHLDVSLTTADGHTGELQQRVFDAGARWDVEEEDF